MMLTNLPLSSLIFAVSSTVAAQVWKRLDDVERPAPRMYHAMAYDSGRGVAVLFGGSGEARTWEFDGAAWHLRRPRVSPPPRQGAAMCYDAARGRVVMYGGDGATDTWEWNGTDWLRRMPRSSPPPLAGLAMAYDVVGGRSVLVADGHTFLWDGIDWTEVSYAWLPNGAALANHSDLGAVVALGGITYFGATDALRRFDGSAWQEIPVSGGRPWRRSGVVLAYDNERQRLVLFGGRWFMGDLNDTWEFDGTTWTSPALSLAPTPRSGHAAVFHGAARRMVLFGGVSPLQDQLTADTWGFDGTAWSRLVPDPDPGQRRGFTLTFDSNRGRALLCGGSTRQGPTDLWQRMSNGWHSVAAAGTPPPARFAAAAAFDAGRDLLVVF